MMEDTEKAEILSVLFAAKVSSQEPQTREKLWRKEYFTLVEEDWIRRHLGKLDVHKSMVTDGMYP